MTKKKNDKLEALLKMKADYQDAVEKQGKGIVKELVKDLFTKCPEVEAIRWNQYTPYFNDGDECVFNVHDPEFLLTSTFQSLQSQDSKLPEITEGEDEDFDAEMDEEEEWVDGWGFEYGNKKKPGKYSKALIKAVEEFTDAFGQLQDVFETCFGDHVQVTCTRKKISVSEYSHD